MFFTHQPPWLLRRAFPPFILAPEVLKVDALICESLIFPDSIPSAALQPVEVDWKTTTKKLVFYIAPTTKIFGKVWCRDTQETWLTSSLKVSSNSVVRASDRYTGRSLVRNSVGNQTFSVPLSPNMLNMPLFLLKIKLWVRIPFKPDFLGSLFATSFENCVQTARVFLMLNHHPQRFTSMRFLYIFHVRLFIFHRHIMNSNIDQLHLV